MGVNILQDEYISLIKFIIGWDWVRRIPKAQRISDSPVLFRPELESGRALGPETLRYHGITASRHRVSGNDERTIA